MTTFVQQTDMIILVVEAYLSPSTFGFITAKGATSLHSSLSFGGLLGLWDKSGHFSLCLFINTCFFVWACAEARGL